MRPSARIAREIRTVAGELVTLLGIGDEAGGGSALRQASSRGTNFKRLTRRRAS
jgi:hypothetical protein